MANTRVYYTKCSCIRMSSSHFCSIRLQLEPLLTWYHHLHNTIDLITGPRDIVLSSSFNSISELGPIHSSYFTCTVFRRKKKFVTRTQRYDFHNLLCAAPRDVRGLELHIQNIIFSKFSLYSVNGFYTV